MTEVATCFFFYIFLLLLLFFFLHFLSIKEFEPRQKSLKLPFSLSFFILSSFLFFCYFFFFHFLCVSYIKSFGCFFFFFFFNVLKVHTFFVKKKSYRSMMMLMKIMIKKKYIIWNYIDICWVRIFCLRFFFFFFCWIRMAELFCVNLLLSFASNFLSPTHDKFNTMCSESCGSFLLRRW